MEDTYGSATWDATKRDPRLNENLVVMTTTEIEVNIACAKLGHVGLFFLTSVGKLSWLEVASYFYGPWYSIRGSNGDIGFTRISFWFTL